MAKVVFKRGPNTDAIPVKDGQLVYNTDTGETWQDVGSERIKTGGDSIDDTQTSPDTTWSGDHIVETLCPPFSKTGPVVTCNPVVGYPLSVKSHLIPQQSGSGDPSPENVRPFVPYTQAELTRCGKNLCPAIGSFYEDKKLPMSIKAGNYIISAKSVVSSDTDFYRCAFQFLGAGLGGEALYANIPRGDNVSVTVSLPNDCVDVRVYAGEDYFSSKGDTATMVDVQIEAGAVATPYTPYTSETYTAPLPAETYGGEVDWGGKTIQPLTEPLPMANRGGGWLPGPEFSYIDTASIFKKSSKIAGCNKLKFHPGTDGRSLPANSFAVDSSGNVVFKADGVSNSETFAAFMQDLVITAEPTRPDDPTPITPSATPTAIPGVNTLYSVGGDTTVEGRENPIATIPTKTSELTNDSGFTTKALGLTSVSPGDLIKIKSVDASGVPTAWERTSLDELEGLYELVNTVTTDTDAPLLIDADSDGIPLKLKACIVRIKTTKTFDHFIMSFTSESYGLGSARFNHAGGDVPNYMLMKVQPHFGVYDFFATKPTLFENEGVLVAATSYRASIYPASDVESVVWIKSATDVPAGTTFEVWGVRY